MNNYLETSSKVTTTPIYELAEEAVYKVIYHVFYTELDEDCIEAGELYLLNILTDQVEKYTIWVGDFNERYFYVCLPTGYENDDDEDNLDDYNVCDFGITYVEEEVEACNQELRINLLDLEKTHINMISTEDLNETFFFISQPYANITTVQLYNGCSVRLIPTHYSLKPHENSPGVKGFVGTLWLNVEYELEGTTISCQEQYSIFKGTTAYSIEISFCSCEALFQADEVYSSNNCSCNEKTLLFMHELNLPIPDFS